MKIFEYNSHKFIYDFVCHIDFDFKSPCLIASKNQNFLILLLLIYLYYFRKRLHFPLNIKRNVLRIFYASRCVIKLVYLLLYYSILNDDIKLIKYLHYKYQEELAKQAEVSALEDNPVKEEKVQLT